MFLLISALIFVAFVANVLSGALLGQSFLTDVGEMITLFAASIAFTIAILKREAAARSETNNHDE